VSERKKSQKGFVAVTLITVLAIALVLIAYATLLYTFTGGEVVVGSVSGNVYYSTNNTVAGPWSTNLSVGDTSVSWYSRINFTSTYSGNVSIIWQLERKNGGWANVSNAKVTTYVVLSGTNEAVYASPNGNIGSNQDWKVYADTNGQYRIKAYVHTIS